MARFPAFPSDQAAPWRSISALTVIVLVVQGCTMMALAILMPAIAADFGGTAGSAPTALLIAMSIANLPVGWLLTRTDARTVLAGGIAMAVAGWIAAAMAQDRAMLMAGMVLAGAGLAAATIVPGIAIITRDVARGRGVALAVYLSATVLAGAVVPPFMAMAADTMGWRAAMMLGALAMALCAPLILLVRRGAAGDTPARRHPSLLPRQSGAARAILAMTMVQFAITGILFASVDSLMRQGLSHGQAVVAFSLANLMGLPALMAGGWIADRIGGRAALTRICVLLALGSISLLTVAPAGMIGLTAFVLLWGVASALPGQAGSMMIADIASADGFPRLLGIATAVSSLIGALAPMATDAMLAASGGPGAAIVLHAALALGAAPLVASARPGSELRGTPFTR